MNQPRGRLATLISAGLACLLTVPAAAQSRYGTPTAPALEGEPPWYIGAGQGFFHDTNAFRTPNGPADTYSSTTLFGGFDQQISRQRFHGTGSVALNRYFDEKQLDNTSYYFALGLDWETASSLSGSLDGGIRQHLEYPAPSSGVPQQTLNLRQDKWVDALARWGGTSLFTIEGRLRHSSTDYSDEAYAARESTGNSGSLALHYGGGGPLRVGIGGRYDRTETPKAGFDPLVPEFLSNTSTGRNVDFFVDYEVSGHITTNLRLSYTDQSNTLLEASDFKGWTGRVATRWQATGKIAVTAYATRDTGFDSTFSSVTFVPPGSPPGTPPVTALYQNNRLTYAADLGLLYSATAKIEVAAGAHYARQHLVSAASDPLGVSAVESTDYRKVFFIGANYEFLRNGTAACRLARELHDVSGGSSYSYGSTLYGCSARFTWQ
jgi:hypothetical protein